MRIGLIDVDGHNFPNLALMKLSAWHKLLGDLVEWYMPFGERYDRVYMSKVFSFSQDYDECINSDEVIKGGTGYDIASRLPEEAEHIQPDYSIYGIPQNTAYGFLTRGCPNKCPWCIVPQKEGMIRPYMDVDDIAIDGRTNLVLMDNNILASGDYAEVQLRRIIKKGYRVDFNQALDARLVDNRFAALLAKVRWIDRRIRFGCDTHAQIAECEKAISLINSYGYRGQYFLYTMIGGKNDLDESYSRISYWWVRNREQREKHEQAIYPFAQPYRDPNSQDAVIPQWQKDMASWVNKHQVFQMTDFMDFEPRKGFKCRQYFQCSR